MFIKTAKNLILAGLCVMWHKAGANPVAAQKTLLEALLKQAATLTASMSNVAENLARVDGSVVVLSVTTSADLMSVMNALIQQHPTGPVSRVSSSIYSADLSANVLDTLWPTTFVVGNIATTAIGSLQSGALIGSTGTTGTIDASGVATRVTLATSSATTNATAMVESFGTIANTTALQNVATNLGDVSASIQIRLDGSLGRFGTINTTAIGAMESGMLTASLTGNMNAAQDRVSTIVTALVGP